MGARGKEKLTPARSRRTGQNFDHLFAANAPLTAEGKPHSSHYLQSKIVRAKERIEAEIAQTRAGGPAAAEGEAAVGEAGKKAEGGKES